MKTNLIAKIKMDNRIPINPEYLKITKDEFQLMVRQIGHSLAMARNLFDYTLSGSGNLTMAHDIYIRPVHLRGYYNSIGKELFEYGFTAVEESRNGHG